MNRDENVTIVATQAQWAIGYLYGEPVMADSFGDWNDAQEGASFRNEDYDEYRCYDGEWVRTDRDGTILE